MVKDLYNPNFQSTNAGDKIVDKITGSNKVDIKNMLNSMEMEKFNTSLGIAGSKHVNENKYSWNKQGMIKAGINPLAASGSLDSVGSATPTSSKSAESTGESWGSDIIDLLNPANIIKSQSKFAKDIIKAVVSRK